MSIGRLSSELSCSPAKSPILLLGDGFYPLNVLNPLKMVPEVCRLFRATANATEVVLAETEQGRGILGVVDGFSPKGVENEGEIRWRKDFLRRIGYKLCWKRQARLAPFTAAVILTGGHVFIKRRITHHRKQGSPCELVFEQHVNETSQPLVAFALGVDLETLNGRVFDPVPQSVAEFHSPGVPITHHFRYVHLRHLLEPTPILGVVGVGTGVVFHRQFQAIRRHVSTGVEVFPFDALELTGVMGKAVGDQDAAEFLTIPCDQPLAQQQTGVPHQFDVANQIVEMLFSGQHMPPRHTRVVRADPAILGRLQAGRPRRGTGNAAAVRGFVGQVAE
jgi:hypothetical protein